MADEIIVRIRAEGQDQFIKDLKKTGVTVEQTGKKVEDTNKKMGKSFSTLGKTLGAAFTVAAVIQFTKILARAAVDIDATNKKIQTVFGESTDAVEDFAKENATSLGLTVNEYKRAAAAVGDLLIPIGFQRKEAAALSNDLVQLSGALSAWTGGQFDASEVSQILTKALLGEREQLKQLGIQISEADVKARLLEKGQKNLTGATLAQAKATATLELITEKSADAQAAFGDDTKTLAEQQLELGANIRELRDNLAEQFIPVLTDVITALNNGLKAWQRFNDAISGRGGQADFEDGLEALDDYALKVERLTLILRRNTVEQENNILATKELKNINARIEAIDNEIASRERLSDIEPPGSEDEATNTLKALKQQLKEQQQIKLEAENFSQEQVAAQNEIIRIQDEIKRVENFLKGVKDETEGITFEFENLFGVIESGLASVAGRTKDIDLSNVVEQIEGIAKGVLLANDSVIEGGGLALGAFKKIKGEEVATVARTEDEKRQLAATSLSAIGSFAQEVTNFRAALAERELQALQEKLDKGLISEREFEQQRAELQREQAVAAKANAIFTAIVNGAAGIVSQFQAGPAGIALAAIVSALTAAQIAVIAAQPIPQFAKGTRFVDGKGYPDGVDTVPAMLTKGERVLTVEDNRRHWDLLNAMEAGNKEAMAKAIAGYGIPVQFKTTYEELYKPMNAMRDIVKDTPFEGIDWSPFVHESSRGRASLGKKLDRIHEALIAQHKHRMTKA